MRRYSKKILSFVLTAAITLTSVNFTGIQVKAADSGLDLSGVTAEVITKSSDNETEKNATMADTYTIDGISYNNYLRYDGVSASATSAKDSASKVHDKNTGSRWESDWDNQYQELTVDFGSTYALKDIVIYWEGASAAEYSLEVSVDGYNFQTLSEVSSELGGRTDEIKLSSTINVRAIRIVGTKKALSNYGYSIHEIGCFGPDAQSDDTTAVLGQFSFEDYYKYTGKTMVYFAEPDLDKGVEVEYKMYVGSTENEPLGTVAASGGYLTADAFDGVEAGNQLLILQCVNKADNTVIGEAKSYVDLQDYSSITRYDYGYNDIAQIYINTNESITDKYVDATISVVPADGDADEYDEVFDGGCEIKLRGNTTKNLSKSPWNIKFSGKKKILGMPKGKKWCLLANAMDKSLIRNKLALDMGLDAGVTYSSESRIVEVYVNGKYNGNYLITEPVEVKENRVEIDAYNEENPDSNDILLELGTRYENDVRHFTTNVLNTTFDINDPEMGELDQDVEDAKVERVLAKLDEFEMALNGDDYNKVLEYIDEDTFVNFYIVGEYFKNADFNFSSTRFYIKDNVIYAGPLWDFDLSSGNLSPSYYTDYYVDGDSAKGYYCRGMNWYNKLFSNHPEFLEKVKERYTELQYMIQNMYKEGSVTENSIDNLTKLYGASFLQNYVSTEEGGAGWTFEAELQYNYTPDGGFASWYAATEHLRAWLEDRNEWLCSEWGIDMEAAYEASKPFTVTEGDKVTLVESGDEYTFGDAKYGYYDAENGVTYPSEYTMAITEDITVTPITEISVVMAEGAGIRYEDPYGIRFQAKVTTDNATALADQTTIQTGMLITTKLLYETTNEITVDSDYTKVDIVNSGWYDVNGDKETNAEEVGTYCGSLVNMKASNYTTTFVAKAYVKVNYINGTSKVVYSQTENGNDVAKRSAAQVAHNMLASDLGVIEYNNLEANEKKVIDTFAAAYKAE